MSRELREKFIVIARASKDKAQFDKATRGLLHQVYDAWQIIEGQAPNDARKERMRELRRQARRIYHQVKADLESVDVVYERPEGP